jgi:hypothetical protein
MLVNVSIHLWSVPNQLLWVLPSDLLLGSLQPFFRDFSSQRAAERNTLIPTKPQDNKEEFLNEKGGCMPKREKRGMRGE